MTTNKMEKDGVIYLQLEGRLDTTTAPGFQAQLLEEMKNGKNIVLDFEKLVYVSSAGLRALLAGQKAAQRGKISMTLIHVASEIMEVFNMTGFSAILKIQ